MPLLNPWLGKYRMTPCKYMQKVIHDKNRFNYWIFIQCRTYYKAPYILLILTMWPSMKRQEDGALQNGLHLDQTKGERYTHYEYYLKLCTCTCTMDMFHSSKYYLYTHALRWLGEIRMRHILKRPQVNLYFTCSHDWRWIKLRKS